MTPDAMTSDAIDRAHSEARSMPDARLNKLIIEGPQGLDPALWQALVDERTRRDRGPSAPLSDSAQTPSDIVLGERNPRYPALAIIVGFLKLVAAAIAVAGVGSSVVLYKNRQPAAAALAIVIGVIGTIVYWAAAESIAVLTDIEANTRAAAEALRSRLR